MKCAWKYACNINSFLKNKNFQYKTHLLKSVMASCNTYFAIHFVFKFGKCSIYSLSSKSVIISAWCSKQAIHFSNSLRISNHKYSKLMSRNLYWLNAWPSATKAVPDLKANWSKTCFHMGERSLEKKNKREIILRSLKFAFF